MPHWKVPRLLHVLNSLLSILKFTELLQNLGPWQPLVFVRFPNQCWFCSGESKIDTLTTAPANSPFFSVTKTQKQCLRHLRFWLCHSSDTTAAGRLSLEATSQPPPWSRLSVTAVLCGRQCHHFYAQTLYVQNSGRKKKQEYTFISILIDNVEMLN